MSSPNSIYKIFNSASAAASGNTRKLSSSVLKISTGQSMPTAADQIGKIYSANKLRQNITATSSLLPNLDIANAITDMQNTALMSASDIVNNMYAIASLALDPLKSAADLASLNTDITNLKSQLSDIASNSFYNTQTLFTSGTINILFGTNTTNNTINLGGVDLVALYNSITATSYAADTTANATNLITLINSTSTSGINVRLNNLVSLVGSNMRRVNLAQDIQSQAIAGMQNAESSIRDVNIAQEAANFVKCQATVMAAQSILAQTSGLMQSALKYFL